MKKKKESSSMPFWVSGLIIFASVIATGAPAGADLQSVPIKVYVVKKAVKDFLLYKCRAFVIQMHDKVYTKKRPTKSVFFRF